VHHLLRKKRKKRILTVCTGNICRSPTAEAVLLKKFEEADMGDLIEIESAGTQAVNFAGAPPNSDAVTAAARRQYSLAGLQARQFELQDFNDFDYILAMDKENYQRISYLRPLNGRAELRLFMSFIPALSSTDVPDPYRRKTAAFENALDLIEMGAGAIVEALKQPQRLAGIR
jgi:protein-tyrosine phosphatase